MAESKRTGKKLEVVRDDDLPFLGASGAWTRVGIMVMTVDYSGDIARTHIL
jgi:hypothetical protein